MRWLAVIIVAALISLMIVMDIHINHDTQALKRQQHAATAEQVTMCNLLRDDLHHLVPLMRLFYEEDCTGVKP